MSATAHDVRGPLTAVTYPAADLWMLAVVASGGHPTRGQILTPNRSRGDTEGSVTNQGVAHVTGAMALAVPPQPQLSVAEGRRALQTTATHLTDPSIGLPSPSRHQGVGRIDGQKIVQGLRPEAKPPGGAGGGNVRW